MKGKLLFLSAYLPSAKSPQAGQKTAFRHLRWLAERYDLWFVGFRNEAEQDVSDADLRELCQEVHLFTVNHCTRLAGICRPPGLPLLVSARWHGGVRDKMREMAARHRFARVHCEWSQMAEYLGELSDVNGRWVSALDFVFKFCVRTWKRRLV